MFLDSMLRTYPEPDSIKRSISSSVLPKKINRLKEDQAFSLSLELGRRENVARHPVADFLLCSVGWGGDFVDTVTAGENAVEREER